ncbi:MAG: hypothetical protein JXA37_00740 [Chloroflexia bacterium]|nr:hypothetical protein [Chloroflexia bacterium]
MKHQVILSIIGLILLFDPLLGTAAMTEKSPPPLHLKDNPMTPSSDGWTPAASPTTLRLSSVDMISAVDGWAVGWEGTILHWTGTQWVTVNSPTTKHLFAVAMLSTDEGWAVGEDGVILHWDGNQWAIVASPTTVWLWGLDMVSAHDGWAAGADTTLHWNGSQWQIVSPSTSGALLGELDMVSANDGWAVGNVILHWNGNEWQTSSSPFTSHLAAIEMVAPDDGWAMGNYGTILHWDGNAWTELPSPTSITLNSVSMVSAHDGWAVAGGPISGGFGNAILHWNGSEWQAVTSPVTDRLFSVDMVSSTDGWAVGDNGIILHYSVSDSQPPVATIHTIQPNPAVQGQDTVYLEGSGIDQDENGNHIVAYQWRSSIQGQLSTQANFTVQASALSAGVHTIFFRVQDDEGDWSPEVTQNLTIQSIPQDIHTLILVNRQKLEVLYSGAEANQVMNKLNMLANQARVKGLVIQLENNAAIAAAYAARGNDYDDKNKANVVASAIRQQILNQWAAYPELEYIVIIGDDRVIPFYRIADGTRVPDTWTFTDDFYGNRQPVTCPHCANAVLYIPDLAIGRLVESPAQIVGQIDTFLSGGNLSLSQAVVTGYDFLIDGAQRHCNALNSDNITANCNLIGASWTSNDFRSHVLQTYHGVSSINGHANAYGFGTPNGFINASDFANASVDFARAVFYTVGCHAGQNVSGQLDLPEAMAIKKANYVANTGYGWGYKGSVGLSEQLMLDFTEHLVNGQSSTIGVSLMAAKHEYYLNNGDFSPYDEKILTESTLYGLPMYEYLTPAAITTRLQERTDAITNTACMETLAGGLTKNSLAYEFPALTAQSTDEGDYYALDDQVYTGHIEPIQPKYVANLTFPQTSAHGVVFRGGLYTETASFDPIIDRAVMENATMPEEPVFNVPGWYPALPYYFNRLVDAESLVILLGQFDADTQAERLYDALNFDVYYHTSSSDWSPPFISRMESEFDSEQANVVVYAVDPSGIHNVIVAYTGSSGVWQSIDLLKNGESWSGSFLATSDSSFIIQVVDNAGNVRTLDNNGLYFQPGDMVETDTTYLPLVRK